MMRKKAKTITMTVTLILAIILICIKVTHFVIIERPFTGIATAANGDMYSVVDGAKLTFSVTK